VKLGERSEDNVVDKLESVTYWISPDEIAKRAEDNVVDKLESVTY
jgi:hypothetical protein